MRSFRVYLKKVMEKEVFQCLDDQISERSRFCRVNPLASPYNSRKCMDGQTLQNFYYTGWYFSAYTLIRCVAKNNVNCTCIEVCKQKNSKQIYFLYLVNKFIIISVLIQLIFIIRQSRMQYCTFFSQHNCFTIFFCLTINRYL